MACRQLGFPGVVSNIERTDMRFFNNTFFWLKNLSCKGSEASLAECQHDGWGVYNCHSAAGVKCKPLGKYHSLRYRYRYCYLLFNTELLELTIRPLSMA